MRNVNQTLADRLESSMQTIANNANPAVQMRIQRHDIPLHDEELIERARIVHRDGLTDSDVAVCHPHFGREDEEIWVAYVRNDVLHIKHAQNTEILSKAEWNDYHYTDDAVACSIAFNSKVKHNARGIWEFVTDEVPWVFWVTPDGELKAKICTPLGDYVHDLALANVTDVSAVRAPSGEWGNWDMGLTVFFLMGGAVYYRQYINNEWYDAEMVTGLSSLTITAIKAFCTWDYRVGLQILTDDGKLYELFSYTEGIGTRGTEHIEISNITADVAFQGIKYWNTREREHINISNISAYVRFIEGNSGTPVETVNTSGTEIEVTFDLEQTAETLPTTCFELYDNDGNYYICNNAFVDDELLTLTFDDFDRSNGDALTLKYTKPATGGLWSPSCQTESFIVEFTPTGLVTPTTPQPTFDDGANSDDMTFSIEFTQDITNTALMANIADHFGVVVNEYEYTPLGGLIQTERTVASVTKTDSRTLEIVIDTPNFSSAIGDITVIYDGKGGLKGAGGMVKAFTDTFTPTDLTWKGHQNDVEHIKIADIDASVTVRPVTYYTTNNNEHLEVNDITAGITLINIHDL